LKTPRTRPTSPPGDEEQTGEIAALRARVAGAEEALRAIRGGEVDTVPLTGKQGQQVFTLQGAEHVYRMLIESMDEGALTLTDNKVILYANQCFARMVNCPLEQVIGRSFRRFLSPADRSSLRRLMKQSATSGTKVPLLLLPADAPPPRPVQISVQEMDRTGSDKLTIGMIVTDMMEVREHEVRLKALTQRVVQAQEGERGRVALELHDNITQMLVAIAFRSEVLVAKLSTRDGLAKLEARALHVSVDLSQPGDRVQLTIIDDGVGFDSNRRPAAHKGVRCLGLLVMHERATYVHGSLTVKSGLRTLSGHRVGSGRQPDEGRVTPHREEGREGVFYVHLPYELSTPTFPCRTLPSTRREPTGPNYSRFDRHLWCHGRWRRHRHCRPRHHHHR